MRRRQNGTLSNAVSRYIFLLNHKCRAILTDRKIQHFGWMLFQQWNFSSLIQYECFENSRENYNSGSLKWKFFASDFGPSDLMKRRWFSSFFSFFQANCFKTTLCQIRANSPQIMKKHISAL